MHICGDITNIIMVSSTQKRPRPDSDDDELDASTIFYITIKFCKISHLSIKNQDKHVTSLSSFVIEKQIEATIGTVKSVKICKNQTLLVETTRK